WLALIGPNGSGKSTLARHLNGLLLPAKGEVWVDGKNTANDQDLLEIRQQVAFVFQNPDNQIVATTVEDDIAFGPENLGIAPNEIARRVEEALTITGLKPLAKQPPHLLSGGEKQKLAIAGALAMGSPYLVMDEPTSMLDPQMRKQILETLLYLHQEMGKGIIYITNLMEEAFLAERLLVLRQGTLMADGSPREIFHNYRQLSDWGIESPVLCRLAARFYEDGYQEFEDVLTLEDIINTLCV
ncbi:MAG: ATP-binding cassette domain-containing protein, partial [Clostridiales bacterium]